MPHADAAGSDVKLQQAPRGAQQQTSLDKSTDKQVPPQSLAAGIAASQSLVVGGQSSQSDTSASLVLSGGRSQPSDAAGVSTAMDQQNLLKSIYDRQGEILGIVKKIQEDVADLKRDRARGS